MPSPSPLVVSPLVARRFLRRMLGLDEPHADIGSALAHHGFIQIDPINICGRMHDLILRNRVAGYREGDLMRYLHGGENGADDPAKTGINNSKPKTQNPKPPAERAAFEQHAPDSGNLAAFPLDAWPHLLAAMRARSRLTSAWSGRLTPRERKLAPALLAEIAARGPLGSEDFEDDRRAHFVVWGAASSLVKATLQKLFFHGRILIAQRLNNRRRYALPERVLPASVLAMREPAPADTARWLVLLKLRQRRLVTLKREEFPLVEDRVQPITVVGCPPVFCLREDAPLLEFLASKSSPTIPHSDLSTLNPQLSTPRAISLLAPLDPLIYDRRLTKALWDFDYTWEAYTPSRKRVRGYYALPVLVGTEIVGHVDPKADRAQRKLVVVSRRIRRGHKVAPAVREFAAWLGLRGGSVASR